MTITPPGEPGSGCSTLTLRLLGLALLAIGYAIERRRG